MKIEPSDHEEFNFSFMIPFICYGKFRRKPVEENAIGVIFSTGMHREIVTRLRLTLLFMFRSPDL